MKADLDYSIEALKLSREEVSNLRSIVEDQALVIKAKDAQLKNSSIIIEKQSDVIDINNEEISDLKDKIEVLTLTRKLLIFVGIPGALSGGVYIGLKLK